MPMIHQPLKRGWNPTHTRPAPHVMEGYAYTNPLAGLTPEDYPTSERLPSDS